MGIEREGVFGIQPKSGKRRRVEEESRQAKGEGGGMVAASMCGTLFDGPDGPISVAEVCPRLVVQSTQNPARKGNIHAAGKPCLRISSSTASCSAV